MSGSSNNDPLGENHVDTNLGRDICMRFGNLERVVFYILDSKRVLDVRSEANSAIAEIAPDLHDYLWWYRQSVPGQHQISRKSHIIRCWEFSPLASSPGVLSQQLGSFQGQHSSTSVDWWQSYESHWLRNPDYCARHGLKCNLGISLPLFVKGIRETYIQCWYSTRPLALSFIRQEEREYLLVFGRVVLLSCANVWGCVWVWVIVVLNRWKSFDRQLEEEAVDIYYILGRVTMGVFGPLPIRDCHSVLP